MGSRSTEITFESYEVLLVKHRGSLNRVWCPACGKNQVGLSLVEIGKAGINITTVRQQAESGRIHLIQATQDSAFVCLESLIAGGQKALNDDG
jgi:hypothetical protein